MPRAHRSSRLSSIVSLLSFSLLTVPAIAATLTVSNIEVTQAIQTPMNTINLVANRGTGVRATVTLSGSAVPIANVSGRLHVFISGVEITPAAGLLPINAPWTAPLAPNRDNENDTLNFELISPTGITASAAVTFRVDLTVPVGHTGVPLTTPNLNVVNRTTPLLFFTRINYTPSGLGLPALATIQPGVGEQFIKGILPVNESEPTFYREGLFPTLSYAGDANGDGILEALGADGNDLISLLASCRQLIVNSGAGASDRIFLYGWLNGNPINGNGLGQIGGRNAFGNTQAIRFQRTYAHEFTHNLGFDHNPAVTPILQTGWDVGGRLLNNPNTNNITGRVRPTTLRDIMDAGILTNQAWIHASQSGSCSSADCSSYPEFLALSTLGADTGGDFSSDTLVIQGIFDPSGERLRQLKPVFRYPWRSQPTRISQRRQNRFVVRLETESGPINVPFDARVADDASNEGAVLGFFEVMIPFRGFVRSLAITDLTGARNFGGFQATTIMPRVEILSPERGARLDRTTTVRARVTAAGTETRMFQAAFSPDGGQSFVPIAVDLREPVFTFDATAIPASAGNGVIRIFISDGLNTTFTDVDRLTTPPLVINSVVNAANYRSEGISPGEIVSIFGQGIGPATPQTFALNAAGLVDTVLAGTRVLFDNQPGPVLYTSSGQVNAIVPFGLGSKSQVDVKVEFGGDSTNTKSVRVVGSMPGIFTQNGSGAGPASVLNQNLTVNSAANPAARGSIIAIYATGEGVNNPPSTDGKPSAPPLGAPVLPVSVTIGGISAEVRYAGAAPGLVAGVIQVNATVPMAALPGSNVPVVVRVGPTASQTDAVVAIR